MACDWFTDNILCVNSRKTEKLVFSNREAERSDDRFLEIYVDARPNWGAHVHVLCKKLARNTFVIKNMSAVVSFCVLRAAFLPFLSHMLGMVLLFEDYVAIFIEYSKFRERLYNYG